MVMTLFSSGFLSGIEHTCNVMDMTACLFIMLIMITAAVQKWNESIHHFLCGLILLLNGISCHVLVRALEFAHRTNGGLAVSTASGNADTLIRAISFIFIFFSIDQFFLQAVSVREPYERKHLDRHRAAILKTLVIIAGIVIYLITDQENVLTVIGVIYLLAGLCFTLKNEDFVFRRAPMIVSVLFSVLAGVLSLVVPPMRATGIALTIMYILLYIEFHTYIETQLSASTKLIISAVNLSSFFIFFSFR